MRPAPYRNALRTNYASGHAARLCPDRRWRRIVGPALVHAGLGIWALYERRQFRWKAIEPLQLVLGLSIPALVISPYARKGFVDHQVLSFDAYVKFIEDDFLRGQRLDPATDGRPDPRPDVRENAPQLGNLIKDFNFNQTPRPPLILPVKPKTDLIKPLYLNLPSLG